MLDSARNTDASTVKDSEYSLCQFLEMYNEYLTSL